MHHVVWLICLFLALVNLSCNRHSVTLSELMDRQDKLSEETTKLSQQVRELRRTYTRELDAKEADFAEYAATVKQLNDTAESMRLTVLEMGNYKREYRRVSRSKAPGMILGEVHTGPRVLKDTTVKEVTDTHISLSHRDGTTRILLADAPLDLQDLFAYDPSLDVLLKETSGTGTDWLLSAMTTAQNYAANQQDETAPRVASSAPRRNISAATPDASYNTSAYQYESRPTWQRFSNFTGSFWSPLQNRKKVVGTVNTVSSSLLSCP